MMVIIGLAVVLGSILVGYVALGGHLFVLWQPFEFLIIGGAGVGSFVIANPKQVIANLSKSFKDALKGVAFTKEDYIELLCMQYTFFKLAKTKGMLALESHVENPHDSSLFGNFPKFLENHHAIVFFCDYMRMLTMGTENAIQMEDLMDKEIEVHHAEREHMVHAIQTMGDGFPALGIVAAVLGVIKTMGHIDAPPAELGHHIGGALVGTFLGILLCYGFVGPLASLLKAIYDAEVTYYKCIKAGILAFLQGHAPSIAVEFSRKMIEEDFRPSFYELEEAINTLPSV